MLITARKLVEKASVAPRPILTRVIIVLLLLLPPLLVLMLVVYELTDCHRRS